MSGGFARVLKVEWLLTADTAPARRRRLLSGTTFEEIVARIAQQGKVVRYHRERKGGKAPDPRFERAVVTIELPTEVVDLFHNSRGGYRAQYYAGAEIGERANRFIVDALARQFAPALMAWPRKVGFWPRAEKSITHAEAKVWIHQGHWLRARRKGERLIRVARWECALPGECDKTRKRRAWGKLAPEDETRIELKGGFVDAEGRSYPEALKPCRGQHIRDCGFTSPEGKPLKGAKPAPTSSATGMASPDRPRFERPLRARSVAMAYTLFYSDFPISEADYRALKASPVCLSHGPYHDFLDALGMAREINARGGVAWEIEGDIGVIGPGEIAAQVRARAAELADRPKVR